MWYLYWTEQHSFCHMAYTTDLASAFFSIPRNQRTKSFFLNLGWTAVLILCFVLGCSHSPSLFHHGAALSRLPVMQRSQRKRSIRSWRCYWLLLHANEVNQQISDNWCPTLTLRAFKNGCFFSSAFWISYEFLLSPTPTWNHTGK